MVWGVGLQRWWNWVLTVNTVKLRLLPYSLGVRRNYTDKASIFISTVHLLLARQKKRSVLFDLWFEQDFWTTVYRSATNHTFVGHHRNCAYSVAVWQISSASVWWIAQRSMVHLHLARHRFTASEIICPAWQGVTFLKRRLRSPGRPFWIDLP